MVSIEQAIIDLNNAELVSDTDKDISTTIGEIIILLERLKSFETKYTGFKDVNDRKIYVGDTVLEGCNGLIGTVGWNKEKGTYKLVEYGDYYIEDSSVEWEVIENVDTKK